MTKLSSAQYDQIVKEAFIDEMEKNAVIGAMLRSLPIAGAKAVDLARSIAKMQPKNYAQRTADFIDLKNAAGTKALYSGSSSAAKAVGKKVKQLKDKLPESEIARKAKEKIVQGATYIANTKPVQAVKNVAVKVKDYGVKKTNQAMDALEPPQNHGGWYSRGNNEVMIKTSPKKELKSPDQILFDRVKRTPTAMPIVATLDNPALPTSGPIGAYIGSTVNPVVGATYGVVSAITPLTHTAPLILGDRAVRKATSKVLGIRNRSYEEIDKLQQIKRIQKNYDVKGPQYVATHTKGYDTIQKAKKQLDFVD